MERPPRVEAAEPAGHRPGSGPQFQLPPSILLTALVVALFGAQLSAGLLIQLADALWDAGQDALPRHLAAVAGGGLWLCLLALLLPAVLRVPRRRALGLLRAHPSAYAPAAIGTFMLGPTGDAMMSLAEAIAPEQTQGNVLMLQGLARAHPVWLLWPFFALLPGIAEELFFRGVVQNAFRDARLGLWMSALTFAAFHIDPHHIAGVLPLALFLSWTAARHGTVVTIFAHVVNNTVALLSAKAPALDVGYGTGRPMPWPWLPLSLCVVGFTIWWLRRIPPPGGKRAAA